MNQSNETFVVAVFVFEKEMYDFELVLNCFELGPVKSGLESIHQELGPTKFMSWARPNWVANRDDEEMRKCHMDDFCMYVVGWHMSMRCMAGMLKNVKNFERKNNSCFRIGSESF